MHRWIDAGDVPPPGGSKVVRHPDGQIALFRTRDGAVHAVDNRCPHEGYPLADGLVAGRTLTCAWHNFKFDLDSGACLKGDEAVRRYAVREVDGRVEIDVTPPDPGPEIARRWRSWREAVAEERIAQAQRDTVRLLHAGVDAREIVAAIAVYDCAHGEYGPSHALPLCADVLHWLPRYPGPRAVHPLSLPLGLAARTQVRRPPRPTAPAIDPGDDLAGDAFADAVEAEDGARAEGLVRGALDRGHRRAVLEGWLFRAAAAHFLDFGHGLIYQTKVFDLVDAVGWAHAAPILVGHTIGLVNGTREDLLPSWMRFRSRLAEVAPRFPSWRGAHAPPADLGETVAFGATSAAVDAVVAALDAGASPAAVADVVVGAAAERLLRFDPRVDARREVQDDWLSVTHVLTHAVAARDTVRRWPHPEALRALLFAVRMVAHHRVLDGPPPPAARPGTVEDVMDAVRRKDADAAVAIARGHLADPALRAALEDLVLEDTAVRHIVVAHQLKTLHAGFDAAAAIGDDRPALAAVRWLASRMNERRVRREADEALALVLEGRTPRRLAP